MEILALALSIIVLITAGFVTKANVRSWLVARRTYEDAMEIKSLASRANDFIVACNAIQVAAEKASQHGRVIDGFATKVIEFDNIFDGQQEYLLDILTNRAVNYADYVTSSTMNQITDQVEKTIARTLPGLLMAKAGAEKREYVLVSTLDGFSASVDLTLRHIPNARMRRGLVRALSSRPFPGKPSETKAAERYINNLFGSDRDFEEFIGELGQSVMEESFTGDLVFKAVPTTDRAMHIV